MRQSREGHCRLCAGAIHARGLCEPHYRKELKELKSVNLCACGCGQFTSRKFISGHNTRLMPQEEQARRAQLNDGAKQRAKGDLHSAYYRKVRGRHEHRKVAEKKLGRKLLPGEIVHHKDENRRNNHPDNLEVMTQSEHIKLHLERMRDAKMAR